MARFSRPATDIQAEALELLRLQSVAPRLDDNGDPVRDALEVQYQVLHARLTDQDIYRLYSDDDYLLDAALRARRWVTDEEEMPPSLDWAEYDDVEDSYDVDEAQS